MVVETNYKGEMYIKIQENLLLLEDLETIIKKHGGAKKLAVYIEIEAYGFNTAKERNESILYPQGKKKVIWTEQDDAYILDNFGVIPRSVMAKTLKCTMYKVDNKLFIALNREEYLRKRTLERVTYNKNRTKSIVITFKNNKYRVFKGREADY
jgi:hypothetical protein